jgi:signal transduction histidine kinase
VALFLAAAYGLIQNFPNAKAQKWHHKFFMTIGIFLAFLAIATNLILLRIDNSDGGLKWIEGIYGGIYYWYGMLVVFFVCYKLITEYLHADKQEKTKISTFSCGIIIFALINIISNIILPGYFHNDSYYWLGDYSMIFFLSFTAYAIVKHQLFNIKVVATEAVVIFLSLFLFIQIFTSSNITEQVVGAIIWLVATYGGWLLIKSVKKEIEQREQIEKLAKDLEKANDELKVLDKAKDDFLSMASHELNTPIAAIEGYLSMILDEGIGEKLGATTKKYLERVYSSAKRLAGLVSDLLDVSRIESGRIHIIYSEGQIEDTIEQAIAEIKPEVDKFKLMLTFHKPKVKMPKTWYDLPRITEVVINIVGNAAKYTPESGKIDIFVEKEDDNILVSVKDNGKGIPEDKKSKVFDKFTQADILKDEVKGTGLGLFIVKNFIEMHKGKAWFDSTVGKGTTFYFTLPILKTQPADPHEGQGAVLH